MTDLITRLEALTGPDREVDALIWVETDAEGIAALEKQGSPEKAVSIKYGCGGFNDMKPIWTLATFRGPAYTASLDAAMTLVPEGWTIATIGQNDDKSWFVELREGFLTSYNRVAMSPIKTVTPAIALCIAAIAASKTP